MLLSLPLDLLIEITLYLDISEKLHLILTCKRIKETIFERCFFETLDLDDSDKEDTELVVLKFRKNSFYGQQVKVLKIQLELLSNQLFAEIPFIFPNVEEFFDYSYKQYSRPEDTISGFLKWKDSLQTLEDDPRTGVMFELLEKNTFSRLTCLEISPFKEKGDHIDFLGCLKNAPALEHLTVIDYMITLEVMESIHSSCPLLVFFKLKRSSVLIFENESLPETIVPASRLSCFIVKSSSFCDQQCVFLHYITKKYTNLIKFEFDPSFSEYGLKPLFQSLTHEEMISSPDFTTKRNEQRLTEEAYSASASKILANLPSTLKIMQIPSLNIHNAMTIFNKKCINLTQLDFISASSACDNIFTAPEDIGLFRNLPFLNRLSVMIDPFLQKYKQNPASTSVTELKVIVKGVSLQNDMDIGWLLSMFPSLNNLCIVSCGARLIGYETNPLRTYPKLTKLTVGPSATHAKLLSFIRAIAPNLKDLDWYLFHRKDTETLEIKYLNRAVIIHPNEPELKEKRTNYTVDLGGFELNCFDLGIHRLEDKDDIILKFKNKLTSSLQYFILKESKYAYFASRTGLFLPDEINKMVTILYDFTKIITINNAISIDLEKSQIICKY